MRGSGVCLRRLRRFNVDWFCCNSVVEARVNFPRRNTRAREKGMGDMAYKRKVSPKVKSPDGEVKSFKVSNCIFHPCFFKSSLKSGFKFYLLCRSHFGVLRLEVNSPRFKSESEAVDFATSDKVVGLALV